MKLTQNEKIIKALAKLYFGYTDVKVQEEGLFKGRHLRGYKRKESDFRLEIPNPLTNGHDLKVLMELVRNTPNELNKTGWQWVIKSPFDDNPDSMWVAGLTPKGYSGWNEKPDVFCMASTMEKAICLVALKIADVDLSEFIY